MKILILLLLSAATIPAVSQAVSNVNWELEGNERIVITYDLAKVANTIYFDVSVKVKIENILVSAKAFSGDVGSYVKVGSGKKIVWNMFEDISALNGELSVEVIAIDPVPITSKPVTEEAIGESPSLRGTFPRQKIPFWAGMGGIGVTGAALLTTGIKSAGEGQDLYKVYKDNRVESSEIYTELGSTRDELFNEANKKYKNGTLLQAAGAAIFLTAGVMIVTRMIQMKKVEQRTVAVTPHFTIDPTSVSSSAGMHAGLTIRYRLR
jgi:hypothetical protein